MGYRIATERRGAQEIFLLHDDTTGASAAVLPSHGFNLFDLRLPAAGEPRRMVYAADDFADNPRHGAGNGVPILFPFPNRIGQATFAFQGRTYSLPANNGPNAIHGFAVDAPWQVIEHKADASAAYITGRYQISHNSPRMLSHWPADAAIEVRYTLAGRRLLMSVTVSNPSGTDLPYGFGIHPYFRLPFPPAGDLDQTRVIIPASKFWVLRDFLPTGEIRAVDARLDFRAGQTMRGLKLDDVLTSLEYTEGRSACRLVDLARNAEFRLGFDRAFREVVVYTPPGHPGVIALEPYTQTTDAINLQQRGIEGGLRVLGHGGQDSFAITMETLG